jgi:Zn-finger nucleic acid-binding protein
MQCPICEVPLTMADRQGVEIDYCPKCRGIWLDRGELDKLIEKAVASQAPAPGRVSSGYYRSDDDDDDDREHDIRGGQVGPERKRRGGFLGDLFDFG